MGGTNPGEQIFTVVGSGRDDWGESRKLCQLDGYWYGTFIKSSGRRYEQTLTIETYGASSSKHDDWLSGVLSDTTFFPGWIQASSGSIRLGIV